MFLLRNSTVKFLTSTKRLFLMTQEISQIKLIDIGANLLDERFSGIYYGKQKHLPDLDTVLNRSWNNGLDKIIVTCGTLKESKQGLELVSKYNKLYSTVGVHPTRCNEFKSYKQGDSQYLNELIKIAKLGKKNGKIVAIGECGLDFNVDRLKFCDKETQLKYFPFHFKLTSETGLPLFLHDREATKELLDILIKNKHLWNIGVIHSFTGTKNDLNLILEANKKFKLENNSNKLYIGINGCSLKKQNNLDVIKLIPNELLLIETDSPYCNIKKSHDSYKYIKTTFDSVKKPDKYQSNKCIKDRCEPCHIIQVLEVISNIKNINTIQLSKIIYQNTINVFFKDKIISNNSNNTNISNNNLNWNKMITF